MQNLYWRHWGILLLLCIICALVNLTKAVHIDDTAHLEITQAILDNPLHPMQGQVNWDEDTAQPAFYLNQPHLLFYIFALWILIFGHSILGLHILMALITSITILFFYLTARLLVNRHALLLTSLFSLGPSFLPGQNLMVDVPLLATWLIFFWSIFSASQGQKNKYYLISAMAVAAACLIKYTSLVLLPIFLFVFIIRRQWSFFGYFLIPILALCLWSLFNYFDYGKIHILGRSVKTFDQKDYIFRIIDWLAGLGSIASFLPVFLFQSNEKRLRIWLFTAVLILSTVFFFVSHHKSSLSVAALWALFFGSGVLTILLTCVSFVRGVKSSIKKEDKLRLERNLILLLWILGAFSFIILFTPFMAIRHILLAIPAVILLLAYNLNDSLNIKAIQSGLILTVLLGMSLGISDYFYADIYRKYADVISKEVPHNIRVWDAGHWGWQWYASKAGMLQYDKEHTKFNQGDYLIVSSLLDYKDIPSKHKKYLKKLFEVNVKSNILTWFRTMSINPWGGYYNFSFQNRSLPWRFSNDVLDTFSVFVFRSQQVAQDKSSGALSGSSKVTVSNKLLENHS